MAQKISPFLWFDTQAEEAAKFYVSVWYSCIGVGRFGAHSNRLRRVVGIGSELGATNQARQRDPFNVSSMIHPTPMQEYRSSRRW
jgi:hypothetical protein